MIITGYALLIVFSAGTLGLIFGSGLSWLLLKSRFLRSLEAEKATLLSTVDQQKWQIVKLEAELTETRKFQQERTDLVETMQEKMKNSFAGISRASLEENLQSFMRLAEQMGDKWQLTAKRGVQTETEPLLKLIDPLQKQLEQLASHVKEMENKRIGAFASLEQQLNLLRDSNRLLQKEASLISQALKSPTSRGRWGELQLRRIVEMAGLLSHCDFFEQTTSNVQTLTSDDATQIIRPDMLIRLPDNKTIIVDAKVPLSFYLQAAETQDEAQRESLFLEHAKQLRTHMQKLSQKAYWQGYENSPEFVVLFLPGESFFSAALQKDPTLIEQGAGQNVIIATPVTLIALLKTVALGWRQEQIQEHTKEISQLGYDLYIRMCDFSQHLGEVGQKLNNTVQTYNKTVGSFERRLLSGAKKLKDIHEKTSHKQLTKPAQLDENIRTLENLSQKDPILE